MRQSLRMRFAPSLAALALFCLLGLLWAMGQVHLYRKIITIWGVEVFDYPFVDSETVLSGARCLRAGVDIYISNPCDTLGRVFDYSPLWMLIAALPVTVAWGTTVGVVVALLYFASLALLPQGRTVRQQWAIASAAISTTAMFAVERGNNDLILFALAAAAATLVCRSPAARLAGYGCALMAGLLKYYPLPLMLVAARERAPRLIAIAIAAVLMSGLFLVMTWHDLTRALRLIPSGDYYANWFGSIQIAGALRDKLYLSASAIPAIRWSMTIAALGVAVWLSERGSTVDALASLTLSERSFLLGGAILIVAAFFSAQNIGYRAIHLLLALPAMLALRTSHARAFRPAAAILLALLWSEGWRRALIYAAKPFGPDVRHATLLLTWLVRETLWWWVVVLLATCVITLLWRSTLLSRPRKLWA